MTYHHNPLFYHKADFAGYAIPRSEGGLGPENARVVLGIECFHHFGITTHPLVKGESPGKTVYGLVRNLWHPYRPDHSTNVTDDNHTWRIEEASRPEWYSRVVLFKNELSPAFHMLPGMSHWGFADGPGAKWFDQEFRVATVGMVACEQATDLQAMADLEAEAAMQRDTVRGRKRAKELRGCIPDARWRAHGCIEKRWPQFSDLVKEPA